jgi:hypothetical protein
MNQSWLVNEEAGNPEELMGVNQSWLVKEEAGNQEEVLEHELELVS